MTTAVKTVLPLIAFNERGRAIIAGTGFKVHVLAGYHRLEGMSAEDLAEMFPHLTKEQINAALAYYYLNKPEFDAELDDVQAEHEKALEKQAHDPFIQRLKQAKAQKRAQRA
jgi:uncharacterized protein (DUF433 family)